MVEVEELFSEMVTLLMGPLSGFFKSAAVSSSAFDPRL